MSGIRSICIVGLDDFPLLSEVLCGRALDERVGGEAVQHWLLARAWRDMGIEVSIVVRDHGQPREMMLEGLRIISAFDAAAGVRGWRFVHPRLTGVWKALEKADAQLYYQSPSSAFTGVAAEFCRRRGRLFIYRVASDANCIPGAQLIRYWRDRKLYEYGLRRAHLIALQTAHQRELLQRHYGLDGPVIDMAVEPSQAPRRSLRDIDVLWVGNFRPVKRPELALELARRLPQLRFAMAGGGFDRRYYGHIERQARTLPNLEFLGPVHYSRIGACFDRARILVCTSSVEGFPNTFLQAWIRGVAVVTLFDPDGLVARERLGCAVGSIDGMAASVLRLMAEPAELERMGARAREFAADRYAAPVVARRYLDLLFAQPRVLQVGPALHVHGGVSSVERLTMDSLAPDHDVRHVPTMEEGSRLHKLRIFVRSVAVLKRELRASRGCIVHVHFASRGSTVRKLIISQMALRARRPLILHAHGGAFQQFYENAGVLLRRAIRSVFSRADALLALSSTAAAFYTETCGTPAQRVHVLPNPVVLPAVIPDRSDHTRVRFLFLGRMEPVKGAFDLVTAFRELPRQIYPHARLVLAGDGADARLRELARGDERISLLPWVDAARRDRLLASSDVFVLPSYVENAPMALLEAMAWGLAVIVTPVGAVPEVLGESRCAVLVQPGVGAELVRAMQLMIQDRPRRLLFGARARTRAEDFSVSAYRRALLAVYRRSHADDVRVEELLSGDDRRAAVQSGK